MNIERSKKPVKEISMVPLINVVFLLLIFFLVAGSIEKIEVLKIETPVAESGEMVDQGHMVIVLGTRNEIIVNDQFVASEAELEKWVKEQLADNTDRLITIKADAKANASRVIDLMRMLEGAGGQHVALATESP
jgi:biopolymer transport protein ExbD